MMYPTLMDWLMLFLCAIFVLPWLLGGLLVIKDMKARYDRRRNSEDRK